VSEWQPISTAPKDGTSLIVCWAVDADGDLIDWMEDLHTADVFVQIASFSQSLGYWMVFHDAIPDLKLSFTPTHWMPLPPQPEAIQ